MQQPIAACTRAQTLTRPCPCATYTAVSRRQLSFLNWKIGIGNGDNLYKEASQISAFVYTTAGARRMKPRA